MTRISELHYSNAYASSTGVSEFVEVALSPGDDPADFTVSFYNEDGTVGLEVPLDDPNVIVTTGTAGETIYVISADNYDFLITDPDGTGSTNYEAIALTNTDSGDVIDFYDIGGGTTEITAVDGAASGATSENLATATSATATTTTIQFNQPDPDTMVYETVDPGASGIICFVVGSLVETPEGARTIETLKVGDLVLTRDNGAKPIRWIGRRSVIGSGKYAPVRLAKGFLGASKTHYVSQQHRILITGAHADALFGKPEVLVPAKALLGSDQVSLVECDEVIYIHIMFDQHEIITVDGVASESFYPGGFGLGTLERAARDEVLALFPELRDAKERSWSTARMVTTTREGEAVAHLL